MTRFENATSFTEFFNVANTMTDGWLAFMLAIITFVIMFLGALPFGKYKALTYSSFVTGVLLLFMNMADMIDYWVIVLDGVILAIGLFMMMHSKRE